jgi:biopolymer transport protein TolQ
VTEFSFIGLFTEATLVVKCIMLTLLAISIVSWSYIFQRAKYFNSLERLEEAFEKQFFSGKELIDLYKNLGQNQNEQRGLIEIFKAGFKEFFINKKQNTLKPDVILENSQRAMTVAISQEVAQLEKNLAFLASVGSVSPYIGLLGTVWGIMNSFIALGSVQQATLSMVAPGIAEALIATAIGLFAAIPAVISYNRYANRVNELVNKYERFQISFTNILARQIYN